MAVDPSTLFDPEGLRVLAGRAKERGLEELWFKCLTRIADLAGQKFEPGVEREFWQAISAAEEIRTFENGKPTRLSRTRQKIQRVGVLKTVADLASSPGQSEGFKVLVRGGRQDLTAEAIVIRHSSVFEPGVIEMARKKLADIEVF
jgi:hypothetical protein